MRTRRRQQAVTSRLQDIQRLRRPLLLRRCPSWAIRSARQMAELIPAYVLHRRLYGDNSLLLEVFTLEEGRIPLIARGAAGGKSRRRGMLQPFVPLLLNWRGRGSVKTLASTETASTAHVLKGRFLYSGFYVNELIMRLLPRNEPIPLLFGHYRATLDRLGQERPLEETLRHFELRLLEELGYAPDLKREASGRPLSPEE
ncbi:MAG TPA: DNA repair protein RecO, partial [Chromatiaceae bacterium]|nr:DNA repair protein RecO [Chromatiaceae bacterium]